MATTTYTTFRAMIVGENRNGQKRDYLPDTLGSTAALLDNAQVQTSTWKYWPYGEVRSGGTATQFLFVGTLGYRVDDTSRSYVRARVLQRAEARWMQVDPLWPSEEQYGYCYQAPSGTADPSGTQGTDPWEATCRPLCQDRKTHKQYIGTCLLGKINGLVRQGCVPIDGQPAKCATVCDELNTGPGLEPAAGPGSCKQRCKAPAIYLGAFLEKGKWAKKRYKSKKCICECDEAKLDTKVIACCCRVTITVVIGGNPL